MQALALTLQHMGTWVFLILGVLVGFGTLVFVHELGHFIFAKLVGIRVEAFALGFGPKIMGRKRGETEYRLNWIPFGGYVKLAGMEGEEGVQPHEIDGGFYAAAPWKRSLAIVAGAGFNFIFAIIVFTALWRTGLSVPESSLSTTIGAVETGMPAEMSGLLPGDTILSIGETEITEWKDVPEAVAFADTDRLNVKVLRDGVEMLVEVQSIEDKQLGAFRIGVAPQVKIVVESVNEGSIADEMGLKKGDEVRAVDGEEVFSLLGFKQKLKDRIGTVTTINVVRGGDEIGLPATVPIPREYPAIDLTVPLGYTTVELAFPSEAFREVHQYPILGFATSPLGNLVKVYRSPGASIKETFGMVYNTLKRLFASLSPKTKVKVRTRALSGPVGIITFIKTSLLVSFSYYVWLIAFLSLNLGIVNLLPVPVLDGGHILFTAIEGVRRKPLPERVMAAITNVFVVLIITFFLYVTVHDVKRNFFPSRERGEAEPAAEQEKLREESGTAEDEAAGTRGRKERRLEPGFAQ